MSPVPRRTSQPGALIATPTTRFAELPRGLRFFLSGLVIFAAVSWIASFPLIGMDAITVMLQRPEFYLGLGLIAVMDVYPLVPWMRDVRGRIRIHFSGALVLALALICGPATIVVFPLIAISMMIAAKAVLWRRVVNISTLVAEGVAGFAVLTLFYPTWDTTPANIDLLIAGLIMGITWTIINLASICISRTILEGIALAVCLRWGLFQLTPWFGSLLAAPIIAHLLWHAPIFGPHLAILLIVIHHGIASSMRSADQVRTDVLTGLANRTAILEKLDEMLGMSGGGTEVALFMIDIDDFKDVNDNYGHHSGDHALTTLGSRIREAAGPEMLAARFGGDEFVVIGSDIVDPSVVANRIHDAINEPITLPDNIAVINISCSIGTAMAKPGMQAMDLLRTADWLMYQVKGDNQPTGSVGVLLSEAFSAAEPTHISTEAP